jgi:hypothetical protein
MNFDWFFNRKSAKDIAGLFGRNGTRLFYGILGAFMASFAAFLI